MPDYSFECSFCGAGFGSNVIELARHIGRVHDASRKPAHAQPSQ